MCVHVSLGISSWTWKHKEKLGFKLNKWQQKSGYTPYTSTASATKSPPPLRCNHRFCVRIHISTRLCYIVEQFLQKHTVSISKICTDFSLPLSYLHKHILEGFFCKKILSISLFNPQKKKCIFSIITYYKCIKVLSNINVNYNNPKFNTVLVNK